MYFLKANQVYMHIFILRYVYNPQLYFPLWSVKLRRIHTLYFYTCMHIHFRYNANIDLQNVIGVLLLDFFDHKNYISSWYICIYMKVYSLVKGNVTVL